MESAQLLQVEHTLERLGLKTMAAQLGQEAEVAAREEISYVQFLGRLLEAEEGTRQTRWMNTRMALAGFPYRKTLADFDFSFQPAVDERLIRELASLSFIDRHENIILLGPPGVGKTHLAVALGIQALHRHTSVYYTTAHDLVTHLRQAQQRGTFTKRLAVYNRPGLLIIDELTYAPFDPPDAMNFFRLVSERYEKGSMILAANRSYGEWGQLFQDPVLATAILDRMLHHSVTINIKGGRSYRLREKENAGVMQLGALTPDDTSEHQEGS